MDSTHSIPNHDPGRYEYYPLETSAGHALLPHDHELVVNKVSGKVTQVDWERRRFVADSSFTDEELPLIMTLLNDWPSHVPYEKMLVVVSDETPEQIAQRVGEARTTNTLAAVLTPVRTILTTCNERMHLFSIDIAAVYETGYLLIPLSKRKVTEVQSATEQGKQEESAS